LRLKSPERPKTGTQDATSTVWDRSQTTSQAVLCHIGTGWSLLPRYPRSRPSGHAAPMATAANLVIKPNLTQSSAIRPEVQPPALQPTSWSKPIWLAPIRLHTYAQPGPISPPGRPRPSSNSSLDVEPAVPSRNIMKHCVLFSERVRRCRRMGFKHRDGQASGAVSAPYRRQDCSILQ
jgi:hypothetical protein